MKRGVLHVLHKYFVICKIFCCKRKWGIPMSNKIYTIGREFGSGGKAVGEALANRLGIKLYDKELLQQAAKDSGFCEEIF